MKIVLVGCGNMGFAMLRGWLDAGKARADDIFVIEPNGELRQRAAKLGCGVAERPEAMPSGDAPKIVVVAVKPQVIRDVLAGYRRLGNGATTFVSIAAGAPVATFADILGADTPIIRCMPNTPAAVGKGMMVLFSNGKASTVTDAFVRDLLSANGEVSSINDESLMDAVTAVSGSGPAYVFHFIECLTSAGVKVGLPRDTAALLAMQTVYGAASLAAQSRENPAELRRQVTSPNGTTAAALDVMMKDERLAKLMADAVTAARDRGIELGK